MKNFLISILILLITSLSQAQKDSVNKKILYSNIAFDITAMTGAYFLLDELWYKNYDQSKLHWFNDCDEWMQMDKLGHSFSTYHLSSLYTAQMKWSGLNKSKSAFIGTGLAFLSISTIELLDAQSKQWGASVCDLTANFIGSSLFLGQQQAWGEQRITLKYTYHTTPFPQYRPALLGESFIQRVIKDYNGQTYWLSTNIRSFVEVN